MRATAIRRSERLERTGPFAAGCLVVASLSWPGCYRAHSRQLDAACPVAATVRLEPARCREVVVTPSAARSDGCPPPEGLSVIDVAAIRLTSVEAASENPEATVCLALLSSDCELCQAQNCATGGPVQLEVYERFRFQLGVFGTAGPVQVIVCDDFT